MIFRSGDPRQGQRRDPADPGRAHVRRSAARRRRARQRGRLQAAGAGPRRARRADALRRGLGNARPGLRQSALEHRHALLDLRHQRAAALRQRRPRARQADGSSPRRHLRHHAGQPRLALRQRLQQVRQDIPGGRPGRRALPRRRRGDHRAEDEERRRRDGAPRRADEGRADVRPEPRDTLQRLSLRPTSTARRSLATRRARPRPRSKRCSSAR